MNVAHLRYPLILMVGLFAGCKSATVHLYTLEPDSTSNPSQIPARPLKDTFILEQVLIPRQIDRKELILRTSARELKLLENDNWASPLREEVRYALTADLRLALANSSDATPLDHRPTTFVSIDIRDWESTIHAVMLKAEWRLKRLGTTEPLETRCESAFLESTTGKADDLVRADQALLEHLAQAIDHVIRSSTPANCGQ
jgi:uncharacterized lipoprotein YmbA